MLDIVSVIVNENRKNMKKGPTSQRRLAIKYTVRLKVTAAMIFDGSSVRMEANASVKGW
jgi:hypothetical protein